MSNIIAVIWDFDKTLVDGYMQDPIFEKYDVDAKKFWEEVNSLPDKYWNDQKVKVNKDTIYLNHFINKTKERIFKGLNNEILFELGKELKFYKGIPEIFEKTKEIIEKNPIFQEYNIKVEHYIVSTGMKKMIEGSAISSNVEYIWGCELIQSKDENGDFEISEIGYTIDNTSKTRAIFEINKGINKNPEYDVNAKIKEGNRRVLFKNMIYIADGPSDVPAFSVIKKGGGSTFAIYPKSDCKAFQQVEKLREDNRVDMYAEADYSEGTTTYMWIINKIEKLAQNIVNEEKSKLEASISDSPKHLT
ncbi:HAD family hydrolase [Fusobacterium polymorphum]|uniref:HAD family hydrolase n=1 Tax=Fusobacterium nucleatum subsp. polymorphum TaxID=76857 RepID=UPI0030098E3B